MRNACLLICLTLLACGDGDDASDASLIDPTTSDEGLAEDVAVDVAGDAVGDAELDTRTDAPSCDVTGYCCCRADVVQTPVCGADGRPTCQDSLYWLTSGEGCSDPCGPCAHPCSPDGDVGVDSGPDAGDDASES